MSLKTCYLALALVLLVIIAGGQSSSTIPQTDTKIAFMAIDEQGPLGILGHVGFGFQLDDNRFVFASFGPEPGHSGGKSLQPGKLDDYVFDNWGDVITHLSDNGYDTYKNFYVDDSNAQNAWFCMNSHREIYYDWAAGETGISENCLTFAKKVLEAYGVIGLPAISWDKRIPNSYYKSIKISTAESVNVPSTRQLPTVGDPRAIDPLIEALNLNLNLEISNWWNSIPTWFSTWKELSLNLDNLLNTVGVVLVLLFGIRLILKNLGAFIANGVSGLVILYLSSTYLGIWINVTSMTLLVCVIGGIPGAILLIILQYFYGISF